MLFAVGMDAMRRRVRMWVFGGLCFVVIMVVLLMVYVICDIFYWI